MLEPESIFSCRFRKVIYSLSMAFTSFRKALLLAKSYGK